MTDTPERQAYQNGKDDMKERILEKLNEELAALKESSLGDDMLTSLLGHLIKRIEKLT